MVNFSPVWRSILPLYLKSDCFDYVVIIASKKHTVFSLNLTIVCVYVILLFCHFLMDSKCLSRIPKIPFFIRFQDSNTDSSVLFFAPKLVFCWFPTEWKLEQKNQALVAFADLSQGDLSRPVAFADLSRSDLLRSRGLSQSSCRDLSRETARNRARTERFANETELTCDCCSVRNNSSFAGCRPA